MSTPRTTEVLLEVLDVEAIEVDVYRGISPAKSMPRVFGGQVVAQALRAAERTVEADHHIHSLQSYFLLGGDPDAPILYRVHRIRSGRSFTTRRVVAIQHGEAIFNMSASFQRSEGGFDHGTPMLSTLPHPESLPRAKWGDKLVDAREIPPADLPGLAPGRRLWFRVEGHIGDDPGLHAAAIAYASDHGPMGAIFTAYAEVGPERQRDEFMAASLDHLVWFHRDARADQWLFFDMQALSLARTRGLATGTIHTEDGVHVATVQQEGLLRIRSASR